MAKSENSRTGRSKSSKFRNAADSAGLSRRAARTSLANPEAPAVTTRGAIGPAIPGSATGGIPRSPLVGRSTAGTQRRGDVATGARRWRSAGWASLPPAPKEERKSDLAAESAGSSWRDRLSLDFEVESARDRMLVERLLCSMQDHGTGETMRSAVIATLRDCLGKRERGPTDADLRRL